jgi:hypothetical protein
LIGLTDETKAVKIESSVNDVKILKNENIGIENKNNVNRNLIAGSFKTF